MIPGFIGIDHHSSEQGEKRGTSYGTRPCVRRAQEHDTEGPILRHVGGELCVRYGTVPAACLYLVQRGASKENDDMKREERNASTANFEHGERERRGASVKRLGSRASPCVHISLKEAVIFSSLFYIQKPPSYLVLISSRRRHF